MALTYVLKKTEEICKIAVKKHSLAILYIPKEFKTPEICKIAIEKYSKSLLHFIEKINQTEEICLISAKKDGMSLKYVKKQTEEVCRLAILDNKTYNYQYLEPIFKEIFLL